MTLRLLDTFSGIGGFSYAAERIVGGYTTVGFVEWNTYCQSVLQKHWPQVPIHGDITTFNPLPGAADVICGGFPCQDISTAGKGAGIKEGTRSGLFYELMRVIRLVRPQFVILENVAAIRSRGLDTVLGQMAEAGYDCEWACIRASDVGACHRRDRWWLVAYPESERRGTWQGQSSPPPRQQGKGISHSTCTPVTPDSHHSRPQGLRPQRQLREDCSQEQTRWRSCCELSPNWRSYLSKPVLCRGDDGLSGRVDRLKALGNAVVPQAAAIPLSRVKHLSTLHSS